MPLYFNIWTEIFSNLDFQEFFRNIPDFYFTLPEQSLYRYMYCPWLYLIIPSQDQRYCCDRYKLSDTSKQLRYRYKLYTVNVFFFTEQSNREEMIPTFSSCRTSDQTELKVLAKLIDSCSNHWSCWTLWDNQTTIWNDIHNLLRPPPLLPQPSRLSAWYHFSDWFNSLLMRL